jgi:hypothetical protein
MKSNKEYKDEIYRLLKGTPVSFILSQSEIDDKGVTKSLLTVYDSVKKTRRAIRYGRNQSSPYVDEQDKFVRREDIIIEDGILQVPFDNPALQDYLDIHPGNKANGGNKFEKMDRARDAEAEELEIDLQADALSLARKMNFEEIETIAKLIIKGDMSRMSSGEIKRDVKVYAKNNPKKFLEFVNDPQLRFKSNVRNFLETKLLHFRKNQSELWIKVPELRKLTIVPSDKDPVAFVESYLNSEEGAEIYKLLANYESVEV